MVNSLAMDMVMRNDVKWMLANRPAALPERLAPYEAQIAAWLADGLYGSGRCRRPAACMIGQSTNRHSDVTTDFETPVMLRGYARCEAALADVSLGPEACWWNGGGCIGCQGLLGLRAPSPCASASAARASTTPWRRSSWTP
jgi:hypothetical protein